MMIVLWSSKWSVTDYYFTFSLHSLKKEDRREGERRCNVNVNVNKDPKQHYTVYTPPPLHDYTKTIFLLGVGEGYNAARCLISRDSTTQIVIIQIFYKNNIYQ